MSPSSTPACWDSFELCSNIIFSSFWYTFLYRTIGKWQTCSYGLVWGQYDIRFLRNIYFQSQQAKLSFSSPLRPSLQFQLRFKMKFEYCYDFLLYCPWKMLEFFSIHIGLPSTLYHYTRTLLWFCPPLLRSGMFRRVLMVKFRNWVSGIFERRNVPGLRA